MGLKSIGALNIACTASPTIFSTMPPWSVTTAAASIGVEHGDELCGVGAMGHAGETLDVGEQRGDLALPRSVATRRDLGDATDESGARCCSKLARNSRARHSS